MKVLQICPYEPPASGWVNRIKLLRRVIEGRGGNCEILDIGPSRTVERPGCICVYGGRDYLVKVWRFSRQGFTVQTHINGEYFRGLLLALAALALASCCGNRRVTTFHAGVDQPFLQGGRRLAAYPLFRLIFALSDVVVCNSDAVKQRLRPLAGRTKIAAIPAFSKQYLEYSPTELSADTERFMAQRQPLLSCYLCYRDGFFTDVVLTALPQLLAAQPQLGLVLVGTGDDQPMFQQRLQQLGVADNVYLAGDLGHDAFMSLLARSDLHLRTPVTDGVSATVLEALSLRTLVVAADNGNRPPGVVTYRADDAVAMTQAIVETLQHRERLVANLEPPAVADTASIEVDVIAGTGPATGLPLAGGAKE